MQTPRSRAGILLCLGLMSSAGFIALPAIAQNVWDTVPSMDVVRNRLSLTDEQEAKLIPIFERRIAELQKVRDQLRRGHHGAAEAHRVAQFEVRPGCVQLTGRGGARRLAEIRMA